MGRGGVPLASLLVVLGDPSGEDLRDELSRAYPGKIEDGLHLEALLQWQVVLNEILYRWSLPHLHDPINHPANTVKRYAPLTFFGLDGAITDILVRQVLDEIAPGGECNILTLGSSTGEEGYDIAMAAAEYRERTGRQIRVNIIISDYDQRWLKAAERGVYPYTPTSHLMGPFLQRVL